MNSPESNQMTDEAIIAKRGEVYGDPYRSHVNIGLAFTALIQQHYDLTLTHPVPHELVAQMMVAMKNQRGCRHRVLSTDSHQDLRVYNKFAEDFKILNGVRMAKDVLDLR